VIQEVGSDDLEVEKEPSLEDDRPQDDILQVTVGQNTVDHNIDQRSP